MTSVASPALEQATQLKVMRYRQAIGLSAVLFVATIALYFPSSIIRSPISTTRATSTKTCTVQNGLRWSTFAWAITTFDDSNWHPLTWISHAMDCQMFGIDPAGHHAMNMAWHAVDVVVLFWVLLFATGFVGRSFMVAALFACIR